MRLSACALLLLACRPDVHDPPSTPPASTSAPSPVAPARDVVDRDREHVLAGGIDRPLPTTTEAITPDRVCVSAVPGGHGLTAERTCTCGDQLACKLTLTADTLELIVRRTATSVFQCDDCTAAWTTCTLPRLTPGQQLRLVHAGRDLGTLTANADGWLVAGTCLPAPSP